MTHPIFALLEDDDARFIRFTKEESGRADFDISWPYMTLETTKGTATLTTRDFLSMDRHDYARLPGMLEYFVETRGEIGEPIDINDPQALSDAILKFVGLPSVPVT